MIPMHLNIKLYITSVCCLFAIACFAQDKKYEIGAPTDLEKTGWNKVLCMKNGNTMLFHFEINKPLLVKVFDSTHKEIASQKCMAGMFSDNLFKETLFQGLFEVNGEAVLFADQEHLSKHGLLRLRFNGTDGSLTGEDRIAESPSMSIQTDFTVVNNKWENNYAIVYCTDNQPFKRCDLHITYYNNRHEVVKTINLDFDRGKYATASVLGADIAPNGIFVSLHLAILEMNSTLNGSRQIVHNYYQGFFIAKDSSTVKKTSVVDLTTEVYPAIPYYTYNPFAAALNVLLLSYKLVPVENSLKFQASQEIKHLFMRFDEADMKSNFSWIKNTMANEYLHNNADSNAFYEGVPVNVFTNENGLSTVISESFSLFADPDPKGRRNFGNYRAYLGNIGITQYDDDGKELWGIVLPESQCYNSSTGFYDMGDLFKKGQTQTMFGDLPEQVYFRQFFALNTYSRNRNFYIIFNDDKKHFNNTLKNPGDTLTSFEHANTFCYTINRKKEVSKKYLFGELAADEYLCSFIEGADFDEQRGVYAALVRYQKGDDVSLRMAWSHLD